MDKPAIYYVGRDVILYAPDPLQVEVRDNINWAVIHRFAVLENWGTQHGLGQVAQNGPTPQTELECEDYSVQVPIEAIHGIWIVDDKAVARFNAALEEAELKLLEQR
jgi:hypothetical protein